MVKVEFTDDEVRKTWFRAIAAVAVVLLSLSALVIVPFYWSHQRSVGISNKRQALIKLAGRDPLSDAASAHKQGEARLFALFDGELPGVPDGVTVDRYDVKVIEGLIRNPVSESARRLHRRVVVYAGRYNQHLLGLYGDLGDAGGANGQADGNGKSGPSADGKKAPPKAAPAEKQEKPKSGQPS